MNTEQLIELEYTLDLDNHYQALSSLPGFVLLESGDKTAGRYDILSAYPYDQQVIYPKDLNKRHVLELLDQRIQPRESALELPFQGGAIGYISYDLGAELMGVKAQPIPFLTQQAQLYLGFYDWAIIADHHLKKIFLYAANEQQDTKLHVQKVLRLWEKPQKKKEFYKAGPFEPQMTKEYYQYAFGEIKQALVSGRSYQVNFTQPFKAQYEGDTWSIYSQVNRYNPAPYAAYLSLDSATIMSFSPERFLLHDNGRLLTSPIKGTTRRSDNPVKDEELKLDLLYSAKNRAENVMIVDLMRNDLAKISIPGSVHVEHLCQVQSYKSIHHLVSTVAAKCKKNSSLLNLFLSCFPGGSITGAPKFETMKLIKELELYGRGVYCGSIVYFSKHGQFDSNIAIRTLTAADNYLHLAAGGGIVIDSECEDEYRECFIKINAIVNGIKRK